MSKHSHTQHTIALSGDIQFFCKVCGARFRTVIDLSQHMPLHTCGFCGKFLRRETN